MINVLGKTYILAARLENHGVFAESENFERLNNNFKSEKPREKKKAKRKFKSDGLLRFLSVSSECPCH